MKVTDAFLGEHAVFYEQFKALERSLLQDDIATLKAKVAMLSGALESHARLENELLFDSMEAVARDIAAFGVMRAEHSTIEQHLHELAATSDLGLVRELVMQTIELARDHFRKEEMVAFSLAEETFGRERLQQLGESWAAARGVRLP